MISTREQLPKRCHRGGQFKWLTGLFNRIQNVRFLQAALYQPAPRLHAVLRHLVAQAQMRDLARKVRRWRGLRVAQGAYAFAAMACQGNLVQGGDTMTSAEISCVHSIIGKVFALERAVLVANEAILRDLRRIELNLHFHVACNGV